MNNPIGKGSVVRIKRGSFVNKGVNGSVSKRSHLVTVHRVARGITATPRMILNDDWFLERYLQNGGDVDILEQIRSQNIFEYEYMEIEVTPSSVIWAGSGGYWRHTSITNVELVSQE
jgi:hypothetical protein